MDRLEIALIPFFVELGRSVEEGWLDAGRDEAHFAQLAHRLLEASEPAKSVPVEDIIDWMFSPTPAVIQSKDGSFGQPPIKLYQGNGFYIQALFWVTSTTSIHQHSFSGAFTPLLGSSVHSTWTFEASHRLKSSLYLGRLARAHTEILRPGDVRPIRAGPASIHQLFHLQRPSVTIVVRTAVESDHLPQLSYIPPGLALDGFRDDRIGDRRLALFDVMLKTGISDVEGQAAQVMSRPDVEGVYRVLSYLVARGFDDAAVGRLIATARARHGDLVDILHEAACSQRRIALIGQLRDEITDVDLRLFLALLMLLPDRDSIVAVVEAEYPAHEPNQQIMEWVARLSGVARVGVELDEVNTILFRALLDGCDQDGILDRLTDEFGIDEVAEQRGDIINHASRLARAEVFAPLFSASPFVRNLYDLPHSKQS